MECRAEVPVFPHIAFARIHILLIISVAVRDAVVDKRQRIVLFCSLAPSILATSSKLPGTVLKEVAIMIRFHVLIAPGIIIAHRVPIICGDFINRSFFNQILVTACLGISIPGKAQKAFCRCATIVADCAKRVYM